MTTPVEPISREDLTATLEDLKGMWAAMIDMTMTLPGAAAYLATRKELPPIIDAIFEQAARSHVAPSDDRFIMLHSDGTSTPSTTERIDAEPPQPSLYDRRREETLRLARAVLACGIPTGEGARQGVMWAKRFANELLSAPSAMGAKKELENLRSLINTPEIDLFLRAVHLEAVHQVERWGTTDDRAKRPADWFWLVGYLAGKALHSQVGGNTEKALHHCISTAAALYNWHCAIKGVDVRMCPGSSDVERIVESAFPGSSISTDGAAKL